MSQRINYIKNPSFKGGKTDFWTALNGTSISSVTDTAHFGEYSLKVQKSDGIPGCGVMIDGYRIPVTAGSTYTASAYIKMPEELESRTYTCVINWYTSDEGGSSFSFVSNSVKIFNYQVSGLGFLSVFVTGVAPDGATHADLLIFQEEAEEDTSEQPFRFFYIDSVLFEETAFIKGFFESITQDEETTNVNKSLSPVPYPEITGMELNADITLNGLIFNTIDEDGVLWVCTDLTGWWGNSEPEVANIPRGLGDGSYDVRGRYAAREIQFSGVFLPPNKELISKAREKLISAIDLVKTNGWLIVDEEPPRASLVRLIDRPEIFTVNARGRTEFSFTLRASDPIKYEWIYNDRDGRNIQQIDMNTNSNLVNEGNSPVPAVFEMHGPMEVGTFIRNLANQQTMTLAQRLRGANETTVITGLYRENGVATVRTNNSPNLVVDDFITVTGSNFQSFNTASSVVTSVIDDEVGGNFQVSYLSEGEDLVRLSITSKSFSANVATLTVTPDSTFNVNTAVVVSGIGSLFNGTYNLASSSGATITYAKAVTPTVITKASRLANVATITTNQPLGILAGDNISVSEVIGEDFNTSSQAVLSVVDNADTNVYQITYTNEFSDFGKYTITNKAITNGIAVLTTLPSQPAPFGHNANNIARVNSNGTIDAFFSGKTGSGSSITPDTERRLLASFQATPSLPNQLRFGVSAVRPQADGKILVGGTFLSFNDQGKVGIAKLGSDGALESVYTGQISNNTILAVSVSGVETQADNKVVVSFSEVISSGASTPTNNLIRRLNSSGTPDTAFNTAATQSANNYITGIALQPVPFGSNNIEIVAVGAFTTFSATPTTSSTANRIARLNSDGTRDTAFTASNGTGANNVIYAVATQPADAAIVIGGAFTTFNSVTSNRIARLTNAGARDATFTTNIGTGANNTISTIAVQPADGKIIVGGDFSVFNGVPNNFIARLNSNGTLDTTFTTNLGAGFSDGVKSVSVQSDGKILVGGKFTVLGGTLWTPRTSFFGISAINSVAFGNNLWVAGGTSGQIRTSTNGTGWVTQASNFGANAINSVAHNGLGVGPLWVAGGASGQIRTSTNGTTWTTRTSTFGTTAINSVAFGGGTHVAVGDAGQLRTSTDAITWTTRTSTFGTTKIGAVAYGDGLWVAGGDAGEMRTSTDAITWTTVNSQFSVDNNIYSIAYGLDPFGTGLWVAVGGGGSPPIPFSSGTITTSYDGITWVTQPNIFGSETVTSVAFSGDNIWIAVGDRGTLKFSFNAVYWYNQTSGFGTSSIRAVAFGNNLWVAAGDAGTLVTSTAAGISAGTTVNRIARLNTDGTLDTTFNDNIGAGASSEVNVASTQADGKVLIGGKFVSGPSFFTTTNADISGVDDAFNGTYTLLPPTSPNTISYYANIESFIQTVAFGNNLWVAGGASGQIRTSTNGTTWTAQASTFGTTVIRSVAFANGLWVAGGESGQLRTSIDAVTWVTRTSQFGATTINSVAFGDGLWVAGGSFGQLRTSTDAITWVTRTSNFGTTQITGVAFGNGVWVAAGGSDTIRTSTDAITWITQTPVLGAASLTSLTFANGIFILTGVGMNLQTSTNGITWTARTSQFIDETFATDVAFGNGLWVAVGVYSDLSGPYIPRISTSTDSITWVSRSTSSFNNDILQTVAFGNNLWVAAGNGGQLATSTNGITWVTRTSGFGSVPSTTVTSPDALAEYSVPEGSLVALSGVNTVDSEQAFVEYATLENPLIGLVDGDVLEIDTYSQEVALNGDASGNRFYLETLAEWVNLQKGDNLVELSYLENTVTKKSLTDDVATIQTFQDHNFRVGDDVKIQGVDEVFNGTYTITLINNPTSFSFAKNNINVALTDVTSPESVVAYADSHVVVYYRSGWLG